MKLVSDFDHQFGVVVHSRNIPSHTVPRIGIEEEIYAVSEDANALEVCVVVFAPFFECSRYIFRLSSTNSTAGKYYPLYVYLEPS